MRLIGLDIGTTTICALVMESETGEILRSVTVPNDAAVPGERYERLQSPMQILRKCMSLLDTLREGFTDVGSIGVTGQMHGILYYDKSGLAVSPLYTWQDGTGDQPCEDGTFASVLTRTTGCPAASGFGGCTYFAHSRLGRVPASAVGLCTIHDYVAMRLAGERHPLCHTSDAASLGLFDTDELQFDSGAIERAGLHADFFPRVTSQFVPVGAIDGIIPVCVAIGDNQASFLGSVSDMRRSVLVNMGTGGQVSFLTDGGAGSLEKRPCFDDKYIAVGASLCGGSAFSMLEKFLRDAASLVTGQPIDSAYGAIDRYLAANPPPSDRLTVDTRFSGTRAEPTLRGSIGKIGVSNFTPAHLIYGVLDGIVEELWTMYDSAPHPQHDILVCAGNGMRKNPALRAACAARFGCEAVTPVYTEEAAFGAALSATVACGVYGSIEQAQKRIQYTKGE